MFNKKNIKYLSMIFIMIMLIFIGKQAYANVDFASINRDSNVSASADLMKETTPADCDGTNCTIDYTVAIKNTGSKTLTNATIVDNISNPAQIIKASIPNRLVEVYYFDNSVYAISRNGKLYAWGYNHDCQLGIGGLNDLADIDICGITTEPTQVKGLLEGKEVIGLYSAYNGWTRFALTKDGEVYAFGQNNSGVIGVAQNGNDLPLDVPTKVDIDNVVDIAVGAYELANHDNPVRHEYAYFLTKDGDVYAAGYNDDGQLGQGNTNIITGINQIPGLNNIIDVNTLNDAGYAIDKDGTVYTWGSNKFGQLGNGNNSDTSTPMAITMPNNAKINDIELGLNSALAKDEAGNLYSWGLNDVGQLGLGNTTNYNAPQAIPGISGVKEIYSNENKAYFIINDNDRVLAWGRNTSGQLGIGNTTNQSTPQPVSIDNKAVIQVAAAYNYTMFLTSEQNVFATGLNQEGKLGIGSSNYNYIQTTPQEITALNDDFITKIAIGKNFARNQGDDITYSNATFAFSADGSLFSWGQNQWGQLGTGNQESHNSPVLADDSVWVDGESLILEPSASNPNTPANQTVYANGPLNLQPGEILIVNIKATIALADATSPIVYNQAYFTSNETPREVPDWKGDAPNIVYTKPYDNGLWLNNTTCTATEFWAEDADQCDQVYNIIPIAFTKLPDVTSIPEVGQTPITYPYAKDENGDYIKDANGYYELDYDFACNVNYADVINLNDVVDGIITYKYSMNAEKTLLTITASINDNTVYLKGEITWNVKLPAIKPCQVEPIAPGIKYVDGDSVETKTVDENIIKVKDIDSLECGKTLEVVLPEVANLDYTSTKISDNPLQYPVKATPAAGYVINPADAITEWIVEIPDIPACVIEQEVAPVTPEIIDPSKPDVQVPTQTDNNVIIVDPGYEIACDVQLELKVPGYHGVAKVEGLTYEISENDDGTYTVSVEADPGYKLEANAVTSWTFKIPEIVACPGEIEYNITYILYNGTNSIYNPNVYIEGKGVEKFEDASLTNAEFVGWFMEKDKIIKALDLEQITGLSTKQTGDVIVYSKWLITPLAPTLDTNVECEENYKVIIPEQEGLEYHSSIEGNTVKVSVTIKDEYQEGYAFKDGVKHEWEFDIYNSEKCPVKPGPEKPGPGKPGPDKPGPGTTNPEKPGTDKPGSSKPGGEKPGGGESMFPATGSNLIVIALGIIGFIALVVFCYIVIVRKDKSNHDDNL